MIQFIIEHNGKRKRSRSHVFMETKGKLEYLGEWSSERKARELCEFACFALGAVGVEHLVETFDRKTVPQRGRKGKVRHVQRYSRARPSKQNESVDRVLVKQVIGSAKDDHNKISEPIYAEEIWQ